MLVTKVPLPQFWRFISSSHPGFDPRFTYFLSGLVLTGKGFWLLRPPVRNTLLLIQITLDFPWSLHPGCYVFAAHQSNGCDGDGSVVSLSLLQVLLVILQCRKFWWHTGTVAAGGVSVTWAASATTTGTGQWQPGRGGAEGSTPITVRIVDCGHRYCSTRFSILESKGQMEEGELYRLRIYLIFVSIWILYKDCVIDKVNKLNEESMRT